MRNLKRALSLALAAIMLLGMMVVGVGAVSYNDFSDRTEIVNKDAVSMLTTLGVIDGKPDGSYAPTEFVTREQMAKMISVIMNQGSDNNDLFVGVPSGLTDVAGNWALGHINYCYSPGIFRNYTKSTMADLNRDDAALLIYNALDVEMIQKYEDGYAISFQDHRTILSAMYGVYKVEGVVVANQWAQLQETGVDAALREGRTTLENVVEYSSTTSNTTTGEGIRHKEPVTFNVDTTVDMLGRTVTLFIEKTTILSNSKVLGVSLKDDINHIEATAATKDTIDGYLKGTGIAADKDTQYYVNYGHCDDGKEASDKVTEYAVDVEGKTTLDGDFNLNGVAVEVIDNNNDGVAEYVLYRIETLSQINRCNDKAGTVTFYELDRNKDKKLDGSASTVTVDFDELVAEDELAADDVVLYIQYGGRTYIKLADYVTDTMTRVDRDTNKELYITVGGEEYRQAYNPDAASMVDPDIEHFDIDTAREDIGFDTRYDFFLDSTGEYIIAYRPTEKTEANYALVLESAWTLNALKRDGQVEILKADGTKGTYYIDWDDSADALADVTSINRNTKYDSDGDGTVENTADDATIASLTDNSRKLELYLGTRDVNYAGTGASGSYAAVNSARGSVIRYSIDENDVLTIEWIMQGNTWSATEDMTIDNTGTDKSTAGVGDNGVILYLDNNTTNGTTATAPAQPKDPSFQYKLTSDYENGSGTLRVTGADSAELNLDKDGTSANTHVSNKTTNYAIDLDTIAFYFDASKSNTSDDQYGVAVGWDNMSGVDINTEVQVYPVLSKKNNGTYEASKLAGVVLFEAPTSSITADYFLVLGANAATSGNWHLTVVFEDGTVDEVTVKNGNRGSFRPTDENHFYQAWSYTALSDGTYKLGSMHLGCNGTNVVGTSAVEESGGKGIAYRLSNQTFALERECDHDTNANLLPYVAYGKDFNIWDVTEAEYKGDEASSVKDFTSTRVHAVVIEDKDALRTAWIWDVEEEDNGKKPGSSTTLDVFEDKDAVIHVNSTRSLDAADVAEAIKDYLNRNGRTVDTVTYNPRTGKANVTYTNGTSVEHDVVVSDNMSSGEAVDMGRTLGNMVAMTGSSDKSSEPPLNFTGKGTVDGTHVTVDYQPGTADDTVGSVPATVADLAIFLENLHYDGGVEVITYDGTDYTWDINKSDTRSKWTDGATPAPETLVKAISNDTAAAFTDAFANGGTVSFTMDLDGVEMTFTVVIPAPPGP